MAHIRYTEQTKGETTILPAPDLRTAERLFRYAVSCATADMRIDLMSGRRILRSHRVEFVETIPSVRDMPRYR